ncbi:hypothetical protein Mal52_17980 [Symmachiella dynata]|uniref:Prenyltransferase and squalene oxidase repeat protein n=1 Tax=Symmachiella dynata TaxID=2527995 RepID=A0A517ZLI1_9PLAN|nr:hypothetical protein [Symmachiella dynata]QDU43326.1 hypothetical protein Mal52_17980 [Symmachiella dynata]
MMLHLGKRFAVAALMCVISADALRAEEKTTDTKPEAKVAKTAVVVDPLNVQIDKAIETTSKRQLTAGVHTPWQIMHGVLALRHDFHLKKSRDSKTTETIKAIDWMGSGALHDGLTLFERTQFGGRARPFTKPYAFEGHANQFFGIFVMSDLPNDFAFKAGPNEVSIDDMIENAKMEVKVGPEITWTLWALSHYLDTNAQWRNRYGEAWSIERMVQIQTRESVISAPCGGTHGLFALAYARNKHLATGGKIRGVWMEADQKIQRFIEEGRVLQNRDGSFSTEYFRGRGFSNEFNDRIAHSGHMLEWLMMALPQSRLKEPWVRNGLSRLANDLVENRKTAAECGPLYHALHSLILYRLRTRSQEYGPDKPTLLVKMEKKTDESQKPADEEKTAAKPTEEKAADKKSAEAKSDKPAAPATEVSESKVTPVAAEAPKESTPAVVIEAPVTDEVEEESTSEAKSEEQPAKAN